MTPEQIELLFRASKSPMVPTDVRAKLSVANPWTMKGHVAEAMQREVARLNPTQARLWAKEAGATMSLQAAAAAQGLAEMTPELADEINRFNPTSEAEQNQKRVRELTKTNPYGVKATQGPDGKMMPGVEPNLTHALELEILDPQLASKLKAEAAPPEPAHNFNEREQSLLLQHGFSLPTHSN